MGRPEGEGNLGELVPPGSMKVAIRNPQLVQGHLQVESGRQCITCSREQILEDKLRYMGLAWLERARRGREGNTS